MGEWKFPVSNWEQTWSVPCEICPRVDFKRLLSCRFYIICQIETSDKISMFIQDRNKNSNV